MALAFHPLTDVPAKFDELADAHEKGQLDAEYPSLSAFLLDCQKAIPDADIHFEVSLLLKYLSHYCKSDATKTRFRAELERFFLFMYVKRKKSALQFDAIDINKYIDFIVKPPESLISREGIQKRFTTKDGIRQVNPKWRPFVYREPKSTKKTRALIDPSTPVQRHYSIDNKTLQATFACLSSFCSHLVDLELLPKNPMRKLKKLNKHYENDTTRKVPNTISNYLWQELVMLLEELCAQDSKYELHRFIILTLKVLFLRISELAYKDRYTPDWKFVSRTKTDQQWVMVVIGKGNKKREVTLPDVYVDTVLARYRTRYLGLHATPATGETGPIILGQRSKKPLKQDRINQIVEECFDKLIDKLGRKVGNKQDVAMAREAAREVPGFSSHWLRHTGATHAIDELSADDLALEMGHASRETVIKNYIAPADRDRHAAGAKRGI